PKDGDQGYLPQLRSRLLESRGAVHRVVQRIAAVPAEQRTVLHAAVAADPGAAERGLMWLLEHFDQPGVVVPALGRLAPAIDTLIGQRGRQLDLFGQALLEAARDARGE